MTVGASAVVAHKVDRCSGAAQHGVGVMDRLARELPTPHEPWVEAFFLELERIARGKQQDAAQR